MQPPLTLAWCIFDARGTLAGPTAVSLEGLHNWSDDKGAGWKTMRKAVPGAGGFIDMFFFFWGGGRNVSQASDFG